MIIDSSEVMIAAIRLRYRESVKGLVSRLSTLMKCLKVRVKSLPQSLKHAPTGTMAYMPMTNRPTREHSSVVGMRTERSSICMRTRLALPERVATLLRSRKYFSMMNSTMLITNSTTAMPEEERVSKLEICM